MENIYNKIFGDSSTLSRKELEDYMSGNLPPEEMNRIEQKIQNSEFNREAVAGFESNPDAIKNLPSIKKPFYSNLVFQSLVIVTVIITATLIIISTGNNNPKEEKTISQNIELSKDEIETIEIQIEEEKEIESLIEIEKEEQITYKKAIENQIMPEANITPINRTETIKAETLEIEKPIVNIEHKIKNRVNAGFVYILDLKTVDYSGIYKSGIKVFTHNLAGLDARYSNYEDKKAETDDYYFKFVPYSEFLKQALEKFVKNNYKGALKDFRLILSQYNDDLNAYFYSGLCYFNLGKWSKATKCFEFAANNQINVFDQEGTWYLALTLLKDKKESEAKSILKEISIQNGYYSEKAKQLLDKLQ